ncbi:MAG: MopE-related protein [Pseudomonadota bacterium]|nr:MopE-related protein [Pseudomonadota bacterium]
MSRSLLSLLPAPFALLALLPSVALATPIRVAIEQGPSSAGTGSGVAAQLNDDTWYDFTATVVTATQIDTAAELAAYDVVILSQSGYYGDQDWTTTMAAAIRAFVTGGGGVLGAGWIDFGLTTATVGAADLDEVLPIDAYPDSTNYFCYGSLSLNISDTSHPVTSGMPSSFSTSSADIEISPLPVDSGATVLGTSGGTCTASPAQALVVDDYGSGRTVYIGLLYGAAAGYNVTDLRSGNADRLLEQAVNWASGGSIDADGDGYTSDVDCDDANARIYPGATERCNSVDDDCDGAVDEGVGSAWYEDADGDDYGDPGSALLACSEPSGYVAVGTDCDDTDASINPAAAEYCNGINDDCDGSTDESAVDALTFYWDADGDLYGNSALPRAACTAPTGYVSDSTDCNDSAPSIHPGATEVCNGLDDDCDTSIDEGATDATLFYADADADTYGDAATTTASCSAPSGYTSDASDCDDRSATVHPGAEERCNGIDDDCDALVDDNAEDSTTWYADDDGDAFGDATSTVEDCAPPTGYTGDATDCDDLDSAIHPGAPESCNGVDDDCDGSVDVGAVDAPLWYVDADGDAFGDVGGALAACDAPDGYGEDATDSDDDDAGTYPGAAEVPYDGIDQDCSGDDLVDADLDGYSAEFAGGDDCDDANPDVYPGSPETEDGIDGDCDGTVDEGTDWYDDDGDGYTEEGGDCDDGDGSVRPSGTELANGVDDDCDGTTDEGTSAYDDDGDGYAEDAGDCNDGDARRSPGNTEIPANGIDDDCDGEVDTLAEDPDADGYTEAGGDCDDTSAAVYPGAPELDDDLDNDCDGETDEGTAGFDNDGDGASLAEGDCDDTDATIGVGLPELTDGVDNDCDGIVDEGTATYDDDGDGYTEEGGDCDDAASAANPGAEEVLNGIDDDCDGVVDAGLLDQDGDGYTVESGDCDDLSGWANPGMPEQCDGIDNDCDGETDEACDEAVEGEDPGTEDPETCGCASGGSPGAGAAALALVLLAGLRRRARAVGTAGRGPAAVALATVGLTACTDADYGLAAKKKQLVVSPGLVDLGEMAVGTELDYTITLTSAAGGAVKVVAVDVLSVAGGGFGDVVGDLPTVELDAPQTLSFHYTATAEAWNRAQITIQTDEESNNSHVVDVRVHTSAALLDLAPDLVDFGAVAIGDIATQSFSLINGGNLDLEVTSLTFSDPAFTTGVTLPLALPAGVATPLGVLFTPEDTLPANATVTVGLREDAVVPFGLLRANDCVNGSADLYDIDRDGFSGCGSDCDDANPAAHPGATESCDEVDEDCDGVIDEGTPCFDDDVDGYTEDGGDCNDNNADIHPGNDEVEGNGRDDDCDGVVDAGSVDADGDGASTLGGDCDDTDATVYAGAPELADTVDNDCDGLTDEGTSLDDADGDGVTETDGDCDDTVAATHPGATELADWQDNDCDGAVDEGTANTDDDDDGYTEIGGDCDDADATVNPSARDTDGDLVDDDCDGVIDG